MEQYSSDREPESASRQAGRRPAAPAWRAGFPAGRTTRGPTYEQAKVRTDEYTNERGPQRQPLPGRRRPTRPSPQSRLFTSLPNEIVSTKAMERLGQASSPHFTRARLNTQRSPNRMPFRLRPRSGCWLIAEAFLFDFLSFPFDVLSSSDFRPRVRPTLRWHFRCQGFSDPEEAMPRLAMVVQRYRGRAMRRPSWKDDVA